MIMMTRADTQATHQGLELNPLPSAKAVAHPQKLNHGFPRNGKRELLSVCVWWGETFPAGVGER